MGSKKHLEVAAWLCGVFYFSYFFSGTGGLNSGPHACWAGALPLEPLLFCEGFFEIGSCELLAWAGFKP
jgi:hypothetical protein